MFNVRTSVKLTIVRHKERGVDVDNNSFGSQPCGAIKQRESLKTTFAREPQFTVKIVMSLLAVWTRNIWSKDILAICAVDVVAVDEKFLCGKSHATAGKSLNIPLDDGRPPLV